MPLDKLDTLLIFDGIAIFFVLFYHAIGGYPEQSAFFLSSVYCSLVPDVIHLFRRI